MAAAFESQECLTVQVDTPVDGASPGLMLGMGAQVESRPPHRRRLLVLRLRRGLIT